MRKCPKCGKYMDEHIEYYFGNPKRIIRCSCGYSETFELSYFDKIKYRGYI